MLPPTSITRSMRPRSSQRRSPRRWAKTARSPELRKWGTGLIDPNLIRRRNSEKAMSVVPPIRRALGMRPAFADATPSHQDLDRLGEHKAARHQVDRDPEVNGDSQGAAPGQIVPGLAASRPKGLIRLARRPAQGDR